MDRNERNRELMTASGSGIQKSDEPIRLKFAHHLSNQDTMIILNTAEKVHPKNVEDFKKTYRRLSLAVLDGCLDENGNRVHYVIHAYYERIFILFDIAFTLCVLRVMGDDHHTHAVFIRGMLPFQHLMYRHAAMLHQDESAYDDELSCLDPDVSRRFRKRFLPLAGRSYWEMCTAIVEQSERKIQILAGRLATPPHGLPS